MISISVRSRPPFIEIVRCLQATATPVAGGCVSGVIWIEIEVPITSVVAMRTVIVIRGGTVTVIHVLGRGEYNFWEFEHTLFLAITMAIGWNGFVRGIVEPLIVIAAATATEASSEGVAAGTGTEEIAVLVATKTLYTAKVPAAEQEDTQNAQDGQTQIVRRRGIVRVHQLGRDEMGKVHGECIVRVQQHGVGVLTVIAVLW